jgi:hypothetical protein
MEQRTPRLGDIVDDYCPRERRITNHAIVAIVEDAIRLTRCTTCDHEHGFKGAREPRRRRKPTETLFEQVMADAPGQPPEPTPRITAPPTASPDDNAGEGVPPVAAEALPTSDPAPGADAELPTAPEEGWPAHRTLIRATLPRLTSEPAAVRPIPEFTMHQRPGRHGSRLQRLAYGPQGAPFADPQDPRAGNRAAAPSPRHGANGNGPSRQPGPSAAMPPGKRRRRRGGKRSH